MITSVLIGKLTGDISHEYKVWYPTPHALLTGYGCRDCMFDNQKLSQKEFIERLGEKATSLELLSTYEGSNEPLCLWAAGRNVFSNQQYTNIESVNEFLTFRFL